MKLFIAGGNSPTGKALIEQLRQRRLRFHAPADRHFVPENAAGINQLITACQPTQLINLTDFISGNHGALKRAEHAVARCDQLNARLPHTLSLLCQQHRIPLLQLSNSYVFDGQKKLGYNENDTPNPQGVYGRSTVVGERAVQAYPAHLILRSGWLFGVHKKGLIKSWLHTAKRNGGTLPVVRRRFSPTHTGDLAAALIAIAQQVDCDAKVWGTYHYSGLETRREDEFAELVLKYAAEFDPEVAALLPKLSLSERPVRPPEIFNSTPVQQKNLRHLRHQTTLLAQQIKRYHSVHCTGPDNCSGMTGSKPGRGSSVAPNHSPLEGESKAGVACFGGGTGAPELKNHHSCYQTTPMQLTPINPALAQLLPRCS